MKEGYQVFGKKALAAAIACLLGASANAEDGQMVVAGLVSEDVYFADIPLVMTATRLKQTRTQTPVSVTVIDRAQIEASGFVEIVDLLRLVPGFQVAHSSGRVFAATYHGQSGQYPNRLQVLIDGRSVYLPLLSSVDWSMLGVQIDDIDRIEVIRGPNSPAYGANAFLGTINIITREPVADAGQFIALRGGDPDMRNVSARHSGGVANLDYRISASYRENSGLEDMNDDVELSEINFRGTYYASVEDEIDIHLGYEGGVTGFQGEGTTNNPDRDRDAAANFQKIRWRHVLSDTSDVNVQFYHNYYRHNDQYSASLSDIFTNSFGSAFTDGLGGSVPAGLAFLGGTPEDDQQIEFALLHGTAQRYDLEAQHLMFFSGGHQLVWGAGLRIDQLESRFYLGHDDVVEDKSSRVFFNGQFLLAEDWTTNVGLMVEEGDIVDPQVSPRLALNWAFAEGHVLRVSSTQAHRTPSLLDANWDYAARTAGGQVLTQRFITLDEVESEEIRSYELGYAGEFPKRSMFVEAKLFREEIRNNISTKNDDNIPQVLGGSTLIQGNDGQSDVQGIEGQIAYRPSSRDFVNFQYSYAVADAGDFKRTDSTTARDIDDATPKHTLSVLGGIGLDQQLDLSMGIYRISGMEWLGEGDEVPGYTRIDARVAKGFQLLGQDSRVALVVQNLGDSYQDFFKENEFDTRSYLEFTMSIQ